MIQKRSVAVLVGLALCALPGCKKDPVADGEGAGAVPPTPPVEKKATPEQGPGPFVEPPATHLLLARHHSKAKDARFIGVELGPAPKLLAPYDMPATPVAKWDGRYRFSASLSGAVASHAVFRDGTWAVERRSIAGGKEPAAISLAVDDISALMAVGSNLFVGAGRRVGVVNVGADKPVFRQLAERQEMGGKAYDLFARDGDLVVAIDDIVTPIWAELLSLHDGVKHLEPWTLPSFINGTYGAAILRISERNERNGTLFAYGGYGIRSGHGYDLTRLEIRGGKLEVGGDVILNSTRLEKPPVLEEHVSRSTGKAEKLIAGTEVTPWTGMAVHPAAGAPEQVLLAAGKRGLLVVPAAFDPDTKATVVAGLRGSVHDVTIIGATVYVLSEGPNGKGWLSLLEHDGRSFQPRGKPLELPESFTRFVR